MRKPHAQPLSKLMADSVLLSSSLSGDISITRLCFDSRNVQPGDLFFAVPGVKTDGAQYITQALAGGAVAVVTQTPQPIDIPHVLVADVRKALALAAAQFYGHPARRMTMIGVTGTNGKTSVTHIIKGIWERTRNSKVGLIGTNHTLFGDSVYPSERTTPDALSLQATLFDMVQAGCEACVMEVSSHALDQHRVTGIWFDRAVFTNLTQDHLDYHSDMDAYFEAKHRLFLQCDLAVVNGDDPYGQRLLSNGFNSISYSALKDNADVVAKNIQYKPDRVEFEAVTLSEIARVEWHTPGSFSVYNALAAVSVCLMEGLRLRDIAQAIRQVPPVEGRMETLPSPPGTLILIDYAHSPDALRKLLASVRGWHKGRLITLFGCGGDRDHGKRAQMGQIAGELSDVVYVTSDNPRSEEPDRIIDEILSGLPASSSVSVFVEPDRKKAIAQAIAALKEGDALLLCGKGHEKEQDIQGVKFPFDEKQIVKACVDNYAQT